MIAAHDGHACAHVCTVPSQVAVHDCEHSMFEDFAIMYNAPFLISTSSTMSLLPGAYEHASAA
jgi:hypothetical protein